MALAGEPAAEAFRFRDSLVSRFDERDELWQVASGLVGHGGLYRAQNAVVLPSALLAKQDGVRVHDAPARRRLLLGGAEAGRARVEELLEEYKVTLGALGLPKSLALCNSARDGDGREALDVVARVGSLLVEEGHRSHVKVRHCQATRITGYKMRRLVHPAPLSRFGRAAELEERRRGEVQGDEDAWGRRPDAEENERDYCKAVHQRRARVAADDLARDDCEDARRDEYKG
mmetsp:Transcript_1288/g.3968  ORF Transcript_1288/g.3968 Transcript_1288/m.3968 type:complete len:231 (-) Transcript_1288:539-1231(-)